MSMLNSDMTYGKHCQEQKLTHLKYPFFSFLFHWVKIYGDTSTFLLLQYAKRLSNIIAR